MRTLVIGGTGMIGAHTAVHLASQGHDVTVGSRHAPAPGGMVSDLPFVEVDYVAGVPTDVLRGYDAVVFSAGQDVRHVAPDDADEAFWTATQAQGVPEVARRAKEAGVSRFVQLGSCYHMVMPELVEANPYVRGRRDADLGVAELADESFVACTLNPPPIVGMLPGATTYFSRIVAWARGQRSERLPRLVAPPGGTNYMTVHSLAQAVSGALERGEPGASYLVGDENLTYVEYFQTVVDLAGGDERVEPEDAPHPFLPDRMIVPGRSTVLTYEPPAAEVALLGYDRGDVRRQLAAMVAAVDGA